jgi:NadR type nicotinamide-nucleotide adenylyltransferase
LKNFSKVVITGPESSGKTTLCRDLARYFNAEMVDEYARQYLNLMGSSYTVDDLYIIAERQIEYEIKLKNQTLIFCDTDLLTMHIWMQEKFKITDLNFAQNLEDYHDRIYFLCKPDIPWEYDPLRENSEDRDRLFSIYENTLKEYKLKYHIIKGADFESRFNFAKKLVIDLLK